jgi:hypothetical protein
MGGAVGGRCVKKRHRGAATSGEGSMKGFKEPCMDLDHPGVMLSSLLIGLVGMALLMYGKKAGSVKAIAIGLVMCVFPYFVHSLVVMWLGAGVCVGGMFVMPKGD